MKSPIRISAREEMSRGKRTLVIIGAVLLSIVFAGIILLAFGQNPINIFSSMIIGAFGTPLRIQSTATKAIPLVIASLGVLVAFKMKFWNIGAEGQITMGACGATFVALTLGADVNPVIAGIAMFVVGGICGAVWAFIPAIFKAKWNINETVFTLMMNYIAIKLVLFLQSGPWRDPAANGFPKIANFTDNFILPEIFGVNAGWILALIAVVFVYFLIRHTKLGYEISVLGESVETARYAGINIGKTIVLAMLISGGLCGITGVVQVAGVEKTLVSTIANGYGFTAIITAWLAKLDPIKTLFVCIAFAALLQGGDYIQIALGVSSSMSSVIEGLILFFVLGSEFFIRYKVHIGKGAEVATPDEASPAADAAPIAGADAKEVTE